MQKTLKVWGENSTQLLRKSNCLEKGEQQEEVKYEMLDRDGFISARLVFPWFTSLVFIPDTQK